MTSRRLLHTTRICRRSIDVTPNTGRRLEWDGSRWVKRPSAATSARQRAQQELEKQEVERRKQQPPEMQAPPAKILAVKGQEDSERSRQYVRGQDSSTLKVNATATLQGVPVPERPLPPAYDDCCMSGCPRCVYDIYTEHLMLYHEALADARKELRTRGIAEDQWPAGLRSPASRATSTPDSEATSAFDRAAEEVNYEIRDLDISLRTFLQFERQLRAKRKAEQAKQIALEHVSQVSQPTAGL